MADNNSTRNNAIDVQDTQISAPTVNSAPPTSKSEGPIVSKRKVNESLSPEKEKIYQNLMNQLSPDNSIVIYSDHKKRVVGLGVTSKFLTAKQ